MTSYGRKISTIDTQKVVSLIIADAAGLFLCAATGVIIGSGAVFSFLFGALLLLNAYIVYKGKLHLREVPS